MTFILFGCTRNTLESDNATLQLTGTLRGSVELHNLNDSLSKHLEGVRIEIEGTNFSALTDTLGNWEIQNLPTRTYSISFSKISYSTWKNTAYSFLGGGVVPFNSLEKSIILVEIPTYKVYLDSIKMPTSSNSGEVYCHTDKYTSSSEPTVVYIASKEKKLLDNPPRTLKTNNSFSNTERFHKDSIYYLSIPVYYNEARGLLNGFNHGDTIYVRAYPFHFSETYYDINARNTVIPGCGEGSNTLTAMVP